MLRALAIALVAFGLSFVQAFAQDKKVCEVGPIKMVTTSWCPACREATAKMKRMGVKVDDVVVLDLMPKEEKVLEVADLLRNGWDGAVPFTIVGNAAWSGWSEEMLIKALACKLKPD